MDRHDTLLIACAEPENRLQLRAVLQERYNLLEAANVQQTIQLLEQNSSCIATVVADLALPEQIGLELLQSGKLGGIPAILLIGEDSHEILRNAFSQGAADVIPLDYEPYAMLRRIETIVELNRHKQHLQTLVEEQAQTLRHSNETIVDVLTSIIEYRSVESGQHILRIRRFTRILLEEVARSCPEYRLNDGVISVISNASALHDIGKISIPDSILMKPGSLTEDERRIMNTHAETGSRILDLLGDVVDPDYLRYARNICHYHHERWDGRGYPMGLVGEQIPICAQVVGLADAYDALTSKRVYKEAFSYSRAVNMILKGECGQFSPKLLECFKHVTDAYEALAQAYADGMPARTEAGDYTLPPPSAWEENSLERIRAKYFALVHYINGLLIEVDLNKGLLHLIYNPYPELFWIREISSFADVERVLQEQVPEPEHREALWAFFNRDVWNFMEEDLRRSTQHFRFRGKEQKQDSTFEITLLRINPMDAQRRTLAILCRRTSGDFREIRAEDYAALPTDSTFLCRNDEGFTLLQLGDHIASLAGYSRRELQDRFSNRMLELILPEDREQVRRSIRTQLIRGVRTETEFRVRHKNGEILWVLDKSRLSIGPDGKEYLNVYLTDITGTKKAYERLQQKLQRYEIILAQTENVLFDWDLQNDTVTFSETCEKIFGIAADTYQVSKTLRDGFRFHPDDMPRLFDHISNLEKGSQYEMAEIRIATDRGRYLWCRFRASAIRDSQGRLAKVVGIIINIDAEKQAEQLLQDRAERDALTRLLNKNAARRQAEEYLLRLGDNARCAMLIIDLDHFKQVNDQYGHLFGDAVLTRTAREIERMFRSQDIVSRIGGDEFMVLMRGVSDRNLVEERCRRLIQVFRSFFHSHNHNLPLSCSVGIALSPEHGSTYYDLFSRADQALYRAKARGKNNYCIYDDSAAGFLPPKRQETSHNTPIDSDVEPGLAEDNIVHHAFQQLYSAKNLEQAVDEILALIGRKMNVSRVYIFENSQDNRFCSNTFEWCNTGIQPEIGNLQNISYEEDIPGYAESFDDEGILYCTDISDLPKAVYDVVAPQGIKSMLHCAIRDKGIFRGYVGFDDCVEHRFWTKDQIRTLRYFSEMLSLFLLKHRQQMKAQSYVNDLRTILDNQNAWIYIINPDNWQLQYLNARTRELAVDAQPGMLCYRALMGRQEPCEGCPGRNIRNTQNACAVMENPRFSRKAQAEATQICWEGRDACLMTCRELQKTGESENCNSI